MLGASSCGKRRGWAARSQCRQRTEIQREAAGDGVTPGSMDGEGRCFSMGMLQPKTLLDNNLKRWEKEPAATEMVLKTCSGRWPW